MRSLSLIISLILLMGLSGSASIIGQDPPRPKEPAQDQDDSIRLSSRLVTVPVSASDASGQPVKDLKPEDIVIEEEGRPQQVVSLGEPGKTPVEIALLFDLSGSTHGQFAFEQQAAIRFIKEVLKPSDAISLFSIGITPKMVRARALGGQEAIAGLTAMEPMKEPTAFFDSVTTAAHYLNKTSEPGSRRVIIVISDGEENYSKNNLIGDALRELQKNDCLFYSINPSGGGIRLNVISTKGQGFMESMASQTGGQAFNLTKIEELDSVFRQIAEELQAQYLFGYYSTDERNDGGFKRITVRAPKRPDLRIRSRQGYYVPKP
ncbi:MAG TPA: VWA domain-containing protein [Blastocatellia bacterium]|nr:VWA domain-containing protein [Blastocatellia bacterium]